MDVQPSPKPHIMPLGSDTRENPGTTERNLKNLNFLYSCLFWIWWQRWLIAVSISFILLTVWPLAGLQ